MVRRAPCRRNAYLGVDEPKLSLGLVFGQALLDEVLNDLLGDAHASTASSEKDGAMVTGGNAGGLHGVDEATDDDGSCALHVVVEHGICMLVFFEGWEGVLPILELDDDAAAVSFASQPNKNAYPGHLCVRAAMSSSRNCNSS